MDRIQALRLLEKCRGQELHTLAMHFGISPTVNGRQNKGWSGQVLERLLGLQINSARAPNFGSWELKSISARIKNGSTIIKETMAITMIDPIHIINNEFHKSHLISKLRKAVIVVRVVGECYTESCFIDRAISFDLSPEIYAQIEQDYEIVRRTLSLNNGDIRSLTGRMGRLIQPRTKGRGHGSISRAFYARRDFLQMLYDKAS